jgi:methylenetetrahydrofolate reductase (NADPH)
MDGQVHRRLARLIAGASLELSPRDPFAGERLRELFAPGTTVFVNHPASVTHHDIVAACTRLRRAGFVPVPHLAARRLSSFTQASDFLRRARAEAAVAGVLVVAGDLDRLAGPFRDSLDLLASGVVERNGIGHLLFAGYPEGHPRIGAEALDRALAQKLALARARGLDATLVTQFGFEPAPIRRWLAGLPERGICCPVRIGVAGPASVATLAKFAVRCGIGASLHALARRHAALARVLTEATPDALLAALFAEPLAGAPVAGLHVFAFGGVRRTAAWIAAWREDCR